MTKQRINEQETQNTKESEAFCNLTHGLIGRAQKVRFRRFVWGK